MRHRTHLPGEPDLAERCEPRLATCLLTTSALVLGAATTISLGLLAVAVVLAVACLLKVGGPEVPPLAPAACMAAATGGLRRCASLPGRAGRGGIRCV